MSEVKTFPCVFCGTKLPTYKARKKHNVTCPENKNRARNQEIGRMANKQYNELGSKEGELAAFECMADDLPDGAYFAMAEEFGLSPEDLL